MDEQGSEGSDCLLVDNHRLTQNLVIWPKGLTLFFDDQVENQLQEDILTEVERRLYAQVLLNKVRTSARIGNV